MTLLQKRKLVGRGDNKTKGKKRKKRSFWNIVCYYHNTRNKTRFRVEVHKTQDTLEGVD